MAQTLAPATPAALPPGRSLAALAAPPGLDLEDLLRILRRRQRIAATVFAVILGATALVTLRQRIFAPVYSGSFRLMVSEPMARAIDPENNASQLADLRPSADLPNLLEVLSSPMLLTPLAEKLQVDPDQLLGGVAVNQPSADANGVIQVNLFWNDPAEGERVLKALAQNYLNYSLSQRQEKLKQGIGFLDEQAPLLQKRVVGLQQELATFRLRYNLLDPGVKAVELQKTQEDLAAALRSLRVKEAELTSLEATVRRGNLSSEKFQEIQALTSQATGLSDKVTFGSEKLTSGTVPSLVGELTNVEKQLAYASASFRGKSPVVESLTAQRDRLRPLLQRNQLESIEAALIENRSAQREQQQQLLRAEQGFRGSPSLQKQYDDIQQRLEVARDNLGAYIKSRETFRLEIAQDTVPWQLIAPPAFGTKPVKPNVQRNLLLGALLGLVGGVGAALLRDRLDQVFHSPRDIEDALPYPLLGGVPFLPLAKHSPVELEIQALSANESFALREALRNLITTFRLLRPDRLVRMVGLTSTAMGEGKSTTTALLAKTFADLGYRVLLVDADMRRSSLHNLVGVDNIKGLSNLLTDDALRLEQLIQHPSPNLSILSAGPAPPDPAKLLSSERASTLIQQLRAFNDYDLVIIDMPPALTLSDPMLIGHHLDGLLFLVSLGKIKKDLPAEALRRIEASGLDVLGLITSMARIPSGGGYDYGYGYGYGPQVGTMPEPDPAPRDSQARKQGLPGFRGGNDDNLGIDSELAIQQPPAREDGADQEQIQTSSRNDPRNSPWNSPWRRLMSWLDDRG